MFTLLRYFVSEHCILSETHVFGYSTAAQNACPNGDECFGDGKVVRVFCSAFVVVASIPTGC